MGDIQTVIKRYSMLMVLRGFQLLIFLIFGVSALLVVGVALAFGGLYSLKSQIDFKLQ